MSKFPVPADSLNTESLSVDEIAELYDGILSQVEGDLVDSSISPFLQKPELPQGLESLVAFNEEVLEGPDGIRVRWIDPKGPEDPTELTDIALAKYYGFLTRWRNYVRSEAARAKDILTICKAKFSSIEAALKIYFRESENVAAADVKSYVQRDPRWLEGHADVLRATIFYSRCNTRDESYATLLNSLSREQSRRAEGFKEEVTAESSKKWRRPLRSR